MKKSQYKEKLITDITSAMNSINNTLSTIIDMSEELSLVEFKETIEDLKNDDRIEHAGYLDGLMSKSEELEERGLDEYVKSIVDRM